MLGESDYSVFRCPACHVKPAIAGELRCGTCGFVVEKVNGIPILVKDRSGIETQIAEARASGLGDWYEAPQADAWQGPYRHHLRKRREYLDHVLAKQGRIGKALDLGCGDGANLNWLSRYAERVYGSDYNLLRLGRAAHMHPEAMVYMADVLDYPAADGAFDLIFFNHVLEHIREDRRALVEVHRILKPEGILILGVPNEGALFWRLAYALQPSVRRSTDHVHFYTARAVSAKCAQAGFRIQEVYPIGWGLPHWGLDAKVRGYKWIDDLFEKIGRAVMPSQATSLYLIAMK